MTVTLTSYSQRDGPIPLHLLWWRVTTWNVNTQISSWWPEYMYLIILIVFKDWRLLLPTVPLKSKLPVSSRFSWDKSRVSRYEILVSRDATLVSRYENLVSRESLKRKFWNTLPSFSWEENNRVSRALVLWCVYPCHLILKRVPTMIPSTSMFAL